MSANGCLFSIYTLTPLHAGAGESSGVVDLPVQREKHTGYPCVFSSGIKGSLRFYAETAVLPIGQKKFSLPDDVETIFGGEGKAGGEGKVVFTDAKILFFPVRSSEGAFKWITCPFVLSRLTRDLMMLGINCNLPKLSVSTWEGITWHTCERPVLLLEDIPISVNGRDPNNDQTYALLCNLCASHLNNDLSFLQERLIVVSDDVFKILVTTATQVIARNVLTKDGSKKSANLWYEEYVPADALFYTIMLPTYQGNAAINLLETKVSQSIIQIGGNETVGYGFVKLSDDLSVKVMPGAGVQEKKEEKK